MLNPDGKFSSTGLMRKILILFSFTDDSQIMQQTKHRTRTMIDRYTRVQQVVRHNAAMKLGL
ncbi:hypothetical protein GCM10007390_48730 [Persicitalea jodogahamensis]|uniref:Uncharacterized protein n=1 Tax=Persicitalea jodogahamensis TaxID=402147 RepID=A0A8J3GBI1_9BACT|nr:hypothetical protein GCM10007390_48730 [Persicitalea jodogahamensis]